MLARARAFVFYFNTERNAVYCVLYVFLFILYNTVFFIRQPWHGEAPRAEQPRHARSTISLTVPTLRAPAPGPSGLVVSVWEVRGILTREPFNPYAL